ncbi:MAG: transcription-repair coupling factor [Bacteroidia bacterium]|nr:transcription-repair coupling factor [Bacteroidia bacterium]
MYTPSPLSTERIWNTSYPLHIQGLKGAAPAFWMAKVRSMAPTPALVLVPDNEAAITIYNDLNLLSEKGAPIAILPPTGEGNPAIVNSRRLERAHWVTRCLQGEPVWLIVTPESFTESLPSPQRWQDHLMPLTPGSALDRAFLIDLLHTYDFVETDTVNQPGEFAWRGSVIDVFSYAHPYPLRLRLESDEVIRIQRFEPETQLSEGELQRAWILPPPERIEENPSAKIYDYLPDKALVFLIEGQGWIANLTRNATSHEVEAFHRLASRTIEIGHEAVLPPRETLFYPTHPQPSFPHNLGLLHEHLRSLPLHRLYLFAENDRQRLRLERLLEPAALPYPIEYHIGSLSAGFYDPAAQIAVYTDHQIFRRTYSPPAHRSFRRSEALALRELYELRIGDVVVHRRHGIARFGGLVPIPHTDPPQEGVKLIFAEDAALYVPIPQIAEIGRYRAPTEAPPKLSRLGSTEWQRTTQRVQQRIKELAIDLVRLYAKRRVQPGYAFSPDTLQQLEMESRFPYEETADQLQAAAEVKKDMESPHPMDRLLCGDVGFGKTEVALRAAFKATQDGKQVAFLAPTTVLVMQHLRTFQARLEGFPVRIEALSRLQTPKQQREILKRLAGGEVDIVIGTHRLLSEDIQFRDLGLVIIDEEHKFGVMAKEKLRARYPSVDTLAMSATPIPRTLQMSLSGIREISLITTPPPNRLPVETRVRPFSWELVKEALEKELSRGGQAFFVHNSIVELPRIQQKISQLLPEAQVAFVHAQMPPKQVEEILLSFIYQGIDVLVTTNLVESGLDIPNANTIIVHHAHRFGLSDLHQLRGRVGRGGRQAYCYFLVPGLHHLSPEALRRLEALEEFSDLGSGFQIAMKDLEIRGAGDFFGREQSGFIADIGYDLYQQFLEEAIAQLKEEEGLEEQYPRLTQTAPQCTVECDWPARIPSDWIPYPSTRLEIYHRLSHTTDEGAIQSLLRELQDRFGPLPEPILILADILRLRWVGDKLGLSHIRVHRQRARLSFSPQTPLPPLVAYFDNLRPSHSFRFIPDEKNLVVEITGISDSKELLALLEGLLETSKTPAMHDLDPLRDR